MGRPLRLEYPGAVYHVTSRGNEKKKIFLDNTDRSLLLEILGDYHDRYGILIHSYVLMDNHYHFILETPQGNLLKVMHGINSRYTGYFNRKYRRSGHLFQGRYKAILVDKESYLLPLSRYLHLNPVRAKMVQRPEQYTWSSYHGFIGRGGQKEWVECSWILTQFSKYRKRGEQRYKEYVEVGLRGGIKSPFSDILGQAILGGEAFQNNVRDILHGQSISEEIVERNRLKKRPLPEDILHMVADLFREDENALRHKRARGNLARAVAVYFIHRYSGMGNKEIGKLFGGIHYSAVSKTVARLKEKMANDKDLLKRVKLINSHVKT